KSFLHGLEHLKFNSVDHEVRFASVGYANIQHTCLVICGRTRKNAINAQPRGQSRVAVEPRLSLDFGFDRRLVAPLPKPYKFFRVRLDVAIDQFRALLAEPDRIGDISTLL